MKLLHYTYRKLSLLLLLLMAVWGVLFYYAIIKKTSFWKKPALFSQRAVGSL